MSLRDIDARAMAIKTMTDSEIKRLHEVEEKAGRFLLPYEMAGMSSAVSRSSGSLRKHWGIPESSPAQSSHADRISSDLTSLMRDKKCHVDLTDLESRSNFDWHVYHSNIDFAYNGAKRLSSAVEEDIFG